MAELVYSAGLTSKLFWLHESRKTAGYILAGWTDKQCFTRMMFEAGLLESSAKPRTIKPIHIDYRTEELLTANGLGEYLKAVKGV